jgi:hypothetical protein
MPATIRYQICLNICSISQSMPSILHLHCREGYHDYELCRIRHALRRSDSSQMFWVLWTPLLLWMSTTTSSRWFAIPWCYVTVFSFRICVAVNICVFFNSTHNISKPVTVAARSKAWTVFACTDVGIVGLNPTQGMDVLCVYVFILCLCCPVFR